MSARIGDTVVEVCKNVGQFLGGALAGSFVAQHIDEFKEQCQKLITDCGQAITGKNEQAEEDDEQDSKK